MFTTSHSFQVFINEAPTQAKVWMEMVQGLDTAQILDPKTAQLCYISVLSALGADSSLPFHVSRAKVEGASREEIKGAVIIGLPAAGNCVIKYLQIALDAYDLS
jgi:alkylhydroperoxidase/carboxymuconolactone decarboxylase family protein YurZ